MNGPQDLGGAHGFGRVVVEEEEEPVFHADWERRIFGISLAMLGRIASLDEFRYARERIPPAEYLGSSYYEKWIATIETLAVEKGVLAEEELESRRRELSQRPDLPLPSHHDPGIADRVLRVIQEGGDGWRSVTTKPRFAVGDAVVARNTHPTGHTRLPRYVRGRRGVIDRVYDAFVLPDTNAHGLGENPEHLYAVRFEGRELWGESAEPGSCLYIDCWESYLRPAKGSAR